MAVVEARADAEVQVAVAREEVLLAKGVVAMVEGAAMLEDVTPSREGCG